MDKMFYSNNFKIHNSNVLEKYNNGALLNCHLPKYIIEGQEAPTLETCGGGIIFDNKNWSNKHYLSIDIEVLKEESVTFFILFWKKNENILLVIILTGLFLEFCLMSKLV